MKGIVFTNQQMDKIRQYKTIYMSKNIDEMTLLELLENLHNAFGKVQLDSEQEFFDEIKDLSELILKFIDTLPFAEKVKLDVLINYFKNELNSLEKVRNRYIEFLNNAEVEYFASPNGLNEIPNEIPNEILQTGHTYEQEYILEVPYMVESEEFYFQLTITNLKNTTSSLYIAIVGQ